MPKTKPYRNDSDNDNLAFQKELGQRAKTISKEERKDILENFKETELHVYLKELFKAMQPDYVVEVTHGVDELGKDLVIVKKDTMTTDVIGVVVKRGNIKSKTLGDVDDIIENANHILNIKPEKKLKEIQSQMRQAFKHPAELRAIFDKLPINKVFVVLAGEISIRGRNRLLAEAMGPVEIFDVNWLINKFTDYYPQIFFEGRLTDFIQSKIQQLETKSWRIKEDKNLSDCYVEPLVRNVDVPLEIDNPNVATALTEKRIPFSQFRSVVSSHKHIILVGDPGTGKSAALAKLSINMLKDAYIQVTKQTSQTKNKAEVPILIAAKDLMTINSSEELLAYYFGDSDIVKRVSPHILMLDALDEVSSQNREELIRKAQQFSEHLDCSLILTSRKIDLLESPPLGFKKYEILPFEASQALLLFEKIHGKDQLLESLKGELNKIKFQIPMFPLSLILLIELVEENKEVPASITELYERFTDIILGRYDRKKGIEVLFEYIIKKRFLASLAYNEFLSKKRLEVPLADYQSFVRHYAKEYSFAKEYSSDGGSLNAFIKEIERVGVLRIDENEVTFGHRSFLDYFAGFYIFDRRDELKGIERLLTEKYFDDLWGDTVFFYVGHKKEISKTLLRKLFSYQNGGNKLKQDLSKFLLGRLLQAGWHSPTKTKVFGIEKAFDLVPELRQEVIEFTEANKWKLPKIFADLYVLLLSDHSFTSGLLIHDLKIAFEKILKKNQNALGMLTLLWAMKPFIEHEEIDASVKKLLDAISNNSELKPEEKARALLVLKVLKRGDKNMLKAIQKKINILHSKNPGIFQKLLPQRAKGEGPRTKKRDTRRTTPLINKTIIGRRMH
jgi:GTPase SAR1 family protein/hemolysin-activating ACP:hemolysin acyltransferase